MYSAEIAARFWSKVDQSGGPDSCWNWTAAIDTPGYGAFGVGSRINESGKRTQIKMNSHKVAFQLSGGIIPPGFDVRHACDNRLCCNPAHLSAGTRSQNVQDALSRNRWLTGERSTKSKLTAKSVRNIRNEHANGSGYATLSRKYGVCEKTIYDIVKRNAWKHI